MAPHRGYRSTPHPVHITPDMTTKNGRGAAEGGPEWGCGWRERPQANREMEADSVTSDYRPKKIAISARFPPHKAASGRKKIVVWRLEMWTYFSVSPVSADVSSTHSRIRVTRLRISQVVAHFECSPKNGLIN